MNASRQGSPAARATVAASLPWLVADVGGTNARFGWVADVARGVEHVQTVPTAGFDGPAAAAAAYLAATAAQRGAARPRRAALAVATAVGGDSVALTNSHWVFSRAALQRELGVERLLLLNDFEALALSLPRLKPAQLRWQGVAPHPRGTLAVIGPGTGLGVGAVVQTAHAWVPLAGEGGHATLAPADDFESAVLQHVRREFDHVSAERLLSGIGLPVLHQATAAVLGKPAAPMSTPAIVEAGLDRSDPVCERTLEGFCALLGGFAGNVALTLGAVGGVYIGGGIVPRLGDRFFASAFRARFEAKGRFKAYLGPIPTAVIVDTLVALSGAAMAIEQDAA